MPLPRIFAANSIHKNKCRMITDHEEFGRRRSWDASIVTNVFSRGGIHAWSIKAVVKPEVVTFGAGIVKYLYELVDANQGKWNSFVL